MVKFLKRAYFPLALVFIGTVFTGAYYSSSATISSNEFSVGTWTVTPTITATGTATATVTATGTATPAGNVVLNELLINAPGSDEDLPMPAGEWIELYNSGSAPVDVSGWYIYSKGVSTPWRALEITSTNAGGGSTTIAPSSSLVVYRNESQIFVLTNGGGSVALYDGTMSSGNLKESFSYTGSNDDKTYAKVPDGSGSFSDWHTPTPGGPNV